MFAKELGGAARVTGAGLDREVDLIEQGGVIIQAGDLAAKALDVSALRADGYQQAAVQLAPDYIFLATRNPIAEIVKTYYRPFAGQKKIPTLIVSQNGVSAINDAKESLAEIFGPAADNIGIIRVSLIDPVDAQVIEGKVNIFYRLPVRLGFGGVGNTDAVAIAEVFKQAGFETEQFFGAKVLAMERTKLFMNLIGMAAAAAGMTVGDGLADPEIFTREVLMLREYAAVIKKNKGSFLTLSGYPIGQISFLLNNVPMPLLVALRHKMINIVAKHRSNKPKDLGEIDYYNGEVVRLGRAAGVSTPINEQIVSRAKEMLH
jgi:ketopantoate reductase